MALIVSTHKEYLEVLYNIYYIAIALLQRSNKSI